MTVIVTGQVYHTLEKIIFIMVVLDIFFVKASLLVEISFEVAKKTEKNLKLDLIKSLKPCIPHVRVLTKSDLS